jgi:hypothetical protein
MVKAIPFKVEGGTHPLADRAVNPGLVIGQADQNGDTGRCR